MTDQEILNIFKKQIVVNNKTIERLEKQDKRIEEILKRIEKLEKEVEKESKELKKKVYRLEQEARYDRLLTGRSLPSIESLL